MLSKWEPRTPPTTIEIAAGRNAMLVLSPIIEKRAARIAIPRDDAKVTISPKGVTPPDVPGSTDFERFVMSLGFDLLRSPTSVAIVSASAAATEVRKAYDQNILMGIVVCHGYRG